MRATELKRRWEYDLRSEPEALWSLVADTNRFNRDVGLPSLVSFDEATTDGSGRQAVGANARRRLRLRYARVEVRWEEEPFEWVRPYGFRVVRRYESGPVAELRVRVELRRKSEGGTRLVYSIDARPRRRLWRLAVPLQLGVAARKFAAVFRHYDELARCTPTRRAAAPPPTLCAASQLTEGARLRLRSTAERIADRGADARLVERLAALIEHGDEMSVSHLRPFALADAWDAERREVLELCLRATREGLLDLRWDVLCPLCRGTKQSAGTLREMQTNLHCATCNIDFTANFDRSVEVTFRPNAALRAVEEREFCVGGPELTPHVVVQQLLAPDARRTVSPLLEEGRYRLRTLLLPGARALVVVKDGGASEVTLRAEDSGAWPTDEQMLTTAPVLDFENGTGAEQLFVLERAAWNDDAATAAEVTALQMFRDLFADEALRPGDRITVGSLTLVFTDLRDSTRLYRQIGDAVAFGAVMSHFDVLRECIAEEGGAIVKTLGDAVMAAFVRPSAALRAVVRAQRRLASPPLGMRPLLLKAGLHTGACIAVTLNGRLDYFGSNV
ncbi:MAG TPA: DUF5939 domain-containing protein, partial [Pyrinomonadaceae bacterium]